MTSAGYALVAAQLIAVGLVTLAAGSLVVGWIDKRIGSADGERLGPPEWTLISILSFFGFAIATMVVHMITGGAVFGGPGVVPGLAVALLVVAARRTKLVWRPSKRYLPVVVLGLALGTIYLLPILVTGGSGVRTGDPPWHLGWTEQLLAGESVPTGPAPQVARNAYPWGYHSILATIVRLVPGSDPLVAHETVHVMLIVAIPLAAACLARLVNRRAGLAAAVLAALAGGYGWLRSGSSAFVASPSEARFGADLVVASPNSVYELFPPALPREVALVVLGAATLAVVIAIRLADRRVQIVAGAAMGIVGLISVPMFVTAAVWTVSVGLVAIRTGRLRTLATVLGSALAVLSLWAGPLAIDYLRFGGFVDISPQLGVEWALPIALASWGVLLPLAIAGVILAITTQPPMVVRHLVACLAGSCLLLGLSIARARLDWGVFANETLLHQGRIWPALHLLGAAFAGIAVMAGYGWVRARSKAIAMILVTIVTAMAVASPVVAARGLTRILDRNLKGFDYDGPDLAADSFARRAAPELGPEATVAVEGSDELAFLLFQLSGVRLAAYDDPRLVGNELRIRFADLAEEWDERIAAGGFDADFVVRRSEEPLADEIVSGDFDGERWVMTPSG